MRAQLLYSRIYCMNSRFVHNSNNLLISVRSSRGVPLCRASLTSCNIRSQRRWVCAHTHKAPFWNTLQHTALQHTAAHCNTATHCDTLTLQHSATHYNTLQHTAAHCNTLQHTANTNITHSNALRHRFHISGEMLIGTLHHTTTYCTTLQHTATHCNTPYLRTQYPLHTHHSLHSTYAHKHFRPTQPHSEPTNRKRPWEAANRHLRAHWTKQIHTCIHICIHYTYIYSICIYNVYTCIYNAWTEPPNRRLWETATRHLRAH